MRYDLAGKCVLVTGASRGIGRAIAVAFAREGARVLANGRDEAALAAVEGTTPLPGDLTREEDARRIAAACGEIDVLVNNAGTTFYGPVEETSDDDVRRVLETNFFAMVRLTRLLLPTLRARRGAVVQVSSPSGRHGFPMISAYAASKGAMNAWSEALRLEAPDVRVSIVYPDVTTSELYRTAPASPSGRAYQERLAAIDRDPPEKVARLVVDAVRRGRGDVYTTWRSRFLAFMCGLSPRLVDRVIARIEFSAGRR